MATHTVKRVALVAGLFCMTTQVSAINIVTTYNPGGAGAVNPAFDVGATQLDDIFNAVEAYYEDIFEDGGHTLTINFWYTDLPTLLGDHDFISADGNNRENVANIKIDTRVGNGGALRSYFYDNTPTLNEEFNMTQTLWRDIGGTNQADWYNFTNPVPDTFEVGFRGAATGGGAVGNIDMFTLVLHEVGHALGMSSASPGTQNEASIDQDYDFDPNFVFGAALAADTVDQPSDFLGHLDDPNALMFPSLGGAGNRILPSHSDLMAMAAGNNYLTVDAPRREFFGGGNWNNDFNWTGTRDPDSNDDAFVRDSQGAGTVISASLTANGFAQNLQVSEGANVDINSFKLDITQDVTVTGLDSDIFINAGGELEADEAFIQDQAEIQMTGGLVDVRRLTIDLGTQLEAVTAAAASVDVSERLVNNGVIDVDNASTITFTSVSATAWDLDGTSGDGELFANGGNLIFDTGGLLDAFDGTMHIDGGFFIRIDAAWTLGSNGGLIDMNGGDTALEAARVTGGTVTISGGTVDVDDVGGDGSTIGQAQFDAPVTMTSGSITIGVDDSLDFDNTTQITGGTITLAQGASLDFNGTTSIGGGTFNTFSTAAGDGDIEFNGPTAWFGTTTINGIARQDGPATVAVAATINADVFDMDGTVGAGVVWFLTDDLTINADAIDTTGGYNGTININNAFASLTINTPAPWTLAGTLNVNHAVNSTNTSIAGQDFTLSGTANINAWTGFAARTDISGDIVFQAANTVLSLSGGSTSNPNTIDGGSITGPGRLSFGTFDALVGNGTVIPSEISMSLGARMFASGGNLLVNSASFNPATFARIGTNDGTGTLFLNGVLSTGTFQALELNGGFVSGDSITNDGTTTGFGVINTDGFNNRNLLQANGGTLVLAMPNTFPPDLDGSLNTGSIEAVSGSVRVDTNFPGVQPFSGTITVGTGQEFRMLNDGINLLGQATLTGGTLAMPQFFQRGNMTVQSSAAVLEADSDFTSVGSTQITSSLSLDGSTVIRNGATVGGGGTLINLVGSQLQLEDGVVLGVSLTNSGVLEVGNSPGIADVNGNLVLTSTSAVVEEMAGTGLGNFDRLEVARAATLDGSLRVILDGGHVPVPGNVYDIIEANLGITGVFSSILFPAVPNIGMGIQYLPTIARLRVGLQGDLNFDGFVGIDDLNIVLGNWNNSADAGVWGMGDPSGDGFVGIDDLNTVLGNWNAGVPPTDIANIPEPGTLSLLCVLGWALNHRTRHGFA